MTSKLIVYKISSEKIRHLETVIDLNDFDIIQDISKDPVTGFWWIWVEQEDEENE